MDSCTSITNLYCIRGELIPRPFTQYPIWCPGRKEYARKYPEGNRLVLDLDLEDPNTRNSVLICSCAYDTISSAENNIHLSRWWQSAGFAKVSAGNTVDHVLQIC